MFLQNHKRVPKLKMIQISSGLLVALIKLNYYVKSFPEKQIFPKGLWTFVNECYHSIKKPDDSDLLIWEETNRRYSWIHFMRLSSMMIKKKSGWGANTGWIPG